MKCYNGRDALEAVEKEKPDLALLDVMLPDIDGFTILQKIREKYTFPVIMLTAVVAFHDLIVFIFQVEFYYVGDLPLVIYNQYLLPIFMPP